MLTTTAVRLRVAAFTAALAAGCVVTGFSAAHAQQWPMFPEPPREHAADPWELDEPIRYGPRAPKVSPGQALGISTAATIGPILAGGALAPAVPQMGVMLATGGILIGPSAGYRAAGLSDRGNAGVLVRCALSVVCLSALIVNGNSEPHYPVYEGSYGRVNSRPTSEYIAVGSAVAVGLSAFWDIITVPRHVEKERMKHRLYDARNEAPRAPDQAPRSLALQRIDFDLCPDDQEPRAPESCSYLKQPATWSFTTPTACR